jgi:septal ring factor EnvC (AmiA/AmiB activator)
MCDLSKFPVHISNEDELRAAYSALRITFGTLTENLAVCIICSCLAYVDWYAEFCFVQTSAEEKKADIEKIETLERTLATDTQAHEALRAELESTKKDLERTTVCL